MAFILASASPRRSELLSQIGVSYQIKPVDICEKPKAEETAKPYVERLALEKAQACYQLCDHSDVVLGSDTTVVFEGEIMGKPDGEQSAIETLLKLSGNTHQVMTAVALITEGREQVVCSVTDVAFRTLTEDECRRYWQTGEPADKAGSYAIQGLAAIFVESIKGSYSGVVGLPLTETASLLHDFGVDIWQSKDKD